MSLTGATAVAVRPHAVVREEVPVLRLQLARPAQRTATVCRLHRSPAGRPGCRPRRLRRGAGRAPVISIFFGGGTPSLFSPELIARLLDGVRERLPLADDAEITLETNPGTVEHGRFDGYLAAGVNRLSFGVQSFDDDKLRRLGRIHSAARGRARP